MKAVVAAFNKEKALVGAFSVITNLRMDLRFNLYIVCCSFQLEAHVVWVQVQYLALVLMDILSAIVSTDSIWDLNTTWLMKQLWL